MKCYSIRLTREEQKKLELVLRCYKLRDLQPFVVAQLAKAWLDASYR